jgi:hypothetical protein
MNIKQVQIAAQMKIEELSNQAKQIQQLTGMNANIYQGLVAQEEKTPEQVKMIADYEQMVSELLGDQKAIEAEVVKYKTAVTEEEKRLQDRLVKIQSEKVEAESLITATDEKQTSKA